MRGIVFCPFNVFLWSAHIVTIVQGYTIPFDLRVNSDDGDGAGEAFVFEGCCNTVSDFEFALEEVEHILPHKMFPHGIAGKDNACTKSKLDYQAETTETANKRQTNFIISIHCTSP